MHWPPVLDFVDDCSYHLEEVIYRSLEMFSALPGDWWVFLPQEEEPRLEIDDLPMMNLLYLLASLRMSILLFLLKKVTRGCIDNGKICSKIETS